MLIVYLRKINLYIMKNIQILLLFLGISIASGAQTIQHKLSMPNPETHYFHVETILSDFEENELTLVMSVWSPGSYLIREYSKSVNIVRAKDENGKELDIYKVRKNQWKVEKGNANKVTLNYEVYAFEVSVRTSFLDLTHGYVNGITMFMFPKGYKDLGGTLTVKPHKSFSKISTALPRKGEGVSNDGRTTTFTFKDFDQLVDCPMEIGNQETFTFKAAGVNHHVAIYGPGNYEIDRLKIDMAKVVEAETAIFGQNPNKDYWFIIHNLDQGSEIGRAHF